MPTTAEITRRYVQAHASIADAITAKGGTVSAGDGFEEFPADIATIPSGGTTDFRLPLHGGKAKPCANNGIIASRTWASCDFGRNDLNGNYIWSDGETVYYSYNNVQLQFEKTNQTWVSKSWIGLTGFDGRYVWTDNDDVYYSNSTNHYVLDKSTSTWTAKTWNGLASFDGDNVWTDNHDIYYSNGTTHYVLNKSTSTWTAKTWTGLTNFQGKFIWNNGNDVYYGGGSSEGQYVLDTNTAEWSVKNWYSDAITGNVPINGYYIWSDGINIYHGAITGDYVLFNDYWLPVHWTGTGIQSRVYGDCIWTDGDNIYYTNNSYNSKLAITKIDSTDINIPRGGE